MGWLFDVLNSIEWKVSPLDILETEARYPGLMDDLTIEAWQRKLVRDQIKGSKSNDDD